jgi:hypothetical protein
MSYLHLPRLVFAGDFLSDVSTVNNDTAHYNNATFQPNFQEFGQGAANGWWNPEGGAAFDLQNCVVQQITLPDGTTQADPSEDCVLGMTIQGSQGRPTGKMVDLDPDQQMVSALWCVQIRICNARNEVLLQGDMATTCFRDIQMRQTDGGKSNGQPLGATWTSVLTNLEWGKAAESSAFLTQLKATTQGNKLSINLNGFGYYYAHSDGRFSLGRVIGTLGPWYEDEPDTFAACRRMYGININITARSTFFGNTNFLFEKDKSRLSIDLGGSFPLADSMGTIGITQTLSLAVSKVPLDFAASPTTPAYYMSPQEFMPIGDLTYQGDPEWLNKTGGLVTFSGLSDEITDALATNQLLLLTPSASKPGQFVVMAREAVEGLLVRADNFVQRIDCGDTQEVQFYAYQWGNPLSNATITLTQEPPTPNTPFGTGPHENPISEVYGNNFPVDGLTFKTTLTTNQMGTATLAITGNAIHTPRVYLDGQIYLIDYQLGTVDPAFGVESVSVHLRDYFEVPDQPAWDDIAAIMLQYSNLYPTMSKYLVDLANPDALQAQKNILLFAFSQDINNTMHMPVTRDLSAAKRQTILKWLANPAGAKVGYSAKNLTSAAPDNPVDPGTPLTQKQARYRQLVKAKNGLKTDFPATENVFENL